MPRNQDQRWVAHLSSSGANGPANASLPQPSPTVPPTRPGVPSSLENNPPIDQLALPARLFKRQPLPGIQPVDEDLEPLDGRARDVVPDKGLRARVMVSYHRASRKAQLATPTSRSSKFDGAGGRSVISCRGVSCDAVLGGMGRRDVLAARTPPSGDCRSSLSSSSRPVNHAPLVSGQCVMLASLLTRPPRRTGPLLVNIGTAKLDPLI